MAKIKKTVKELRAGFKEADKRLLQAETDLKDFREFVKRWKKMNDNIKTLEQYYHAQWLEDVEAFNKVSDKNEYYNSCSQDAIWNTSQDFYSEKIKLIKLLVSSL